MSQPVAVLGSIREMLKPGGTLIVADERTEDSFTAPASETERVFYAYSVLCCLPSALDDHTSAGPGGGLPPPDPARLPPLLSARPLAGIRCPSDEPTSRPRASASPDT